jgi:hypothetical protein
MPLQTASSANFSRNNALYWAETSIYKLMNLIVRGGTTKQKLAKLT